MLQRAIRHYYLTTLLKIELLEKKYQKVVTKVVTKEDLIKYVNILQYEPFDLTEYQINVYLSELCSERLSVIPKYSSVNLHALLKVFDESKLEVIRKFMAPVTKMNY